MGIAHTLEGWAAGMAAPRVDARAAFEREAMPHAADLFRTALRMTGERSRAEDAVQETYLQAWKSWSRFEVGTNCRAWLYRILFFCVHHQRRKLLRFPVAGDSGEILERGISTPEPVSDELRDDQILAALDGLPPDYRAAVTLVDIEEFPYKEAAEVLGVPIGTVMSRLSRGRALLRRKLAAAARGFGIGGAEGDRP